MKKITELKLIESFAKLKHPLTGDRFTEQTAYETLLDQQVVDVLKKLAFDLDESDYLLINDNNIIVSLAYGRHPESGKKLTKGTALLALKHKQVRSGLERLAVNLLPENQCVDSNKTENKKSPVTIFSVASMLVLSVIATYLVVYFLDHREKQLFGISGLNKPSRQQAIAGQQLDNDLKVPIENTGDADSVEDNKTPKLAETEKAEVQEHTQVQNDPSLLPDISNNILKKKLLSIVPKKYECLNTEIPIHNKLESSMGLSSQPYPRLLIETLEDSEKNQMAIQTRDFFSQQGFYEKQEVNIPSAGGASSKQGLQYRLTWDGYLAQAANDCFKLGLRTVASIVGKKKLPMKTLGYETWQVTYSTVVKEQASWKNSNKIVALYPEIEIQLEPKQASVLLVRTPEGWASRDELSRELNVAYSTNNKRLDRLRESIIKKRRVSPIDSIDIKILYNRYLGKRNTRRNSSPCMQLSLKRWGDNKSGRKNKNKKNIPFTATYYDLPKENRTKYAYQTLTTELYKWHALEAAGLASFEILGASQVEVKRDKNIAVENGMRFTLNEEVRDFFNIHRRSRGCIPLGITKNKAVMIRPHTNSNVFSRKKGVATIMPFQLELLLRGEVNNPPAIVQKLAKHLPALEDVLENGYPVIGKVHFARPPGSYRNRDLDAEPEWHLQSIKAIFPQLETWLFTPEYAQYFPLTIKNRAVGKTLLKTSHQAFKKASKKKIISIQKYNDPAKKAKKRNRISAVKDDKVPYPANNLEVHAIAVYKGKLPNGQHRGFRKHLEGDVEVRVEKTDAPVFLLLQSYEPENWQIKVADGAQLKKVLAIGHHKQRVTVTGMDGVEIETPRFLEVNTKKRMTYENEGNYTVDNGDFIKAITGVLPRSFQGSYTAKKPFVISQSLNKFSKNELKSNHFSSYNQIALKLDHSSKLAYPDSDNLLIARRNPVGATTNWLASEDFGKGKLYFEAKLKVQGAIAPGAHTTIFIQRPEEQAPFGDGVRIIKFGENKAYQNDDHFGVAIDLDNHFVYVQVNGEWVTGKPDSADGYPLETGYNYVPVFSASGAGKNGSSWWHVNFGGTAFKYPLPEGYSPYTPKQKE